LSLFIPLFFISCNFGTTDPVQYTIIFDSNNENASGTTNSITADANTTVTLTTNAFVLSGYTFEGWNTKKDGTGTTYADNDSIELIEDLTLYAQWKIIKYTISFDGNAEDVSGTTERIQPEANKTITLPANGFSRTGYSFTSWNTASDGLGTSYAEGDSLKVTENLTLYAQWTLATVPTYEINIASAENGNISVSHSVAKAGTEITVTLTPDEFYQFDSISVSDSVGANIETKSVSGNTIIYTFSMPEKAVTISAAFKQITYTVTFISNNTAATGTTSSYSAGADSTITLTQNGFSLAGYTFSGWNTAADGSGTGYEDKASVRLTDNLTLYAQWILATIPTYSINTATTQNGIITVNKNIAEAGTEITVTLTPNELYALDSISIKSVDGSAIAATQVPGTVNAYTFTMPEQNVTVSATFKYIAHSIKIVPTENGRITVNKTDAVAGDLITVTVNPDTDYLVDTISVAQEDGSVVTITQVEANSNTYYFTMPDFAVNINAQFKIVSYQVIFYPNNASATGQTNSMIAGKNTTITLTQNGFVLEGYNFNGWNTKADGTGLYYTNGASLTLSENITLYAQWSLIITNNNIVTIIESLQESKLLRCEGEFDCDAISNINIALKHLYSKNPDIMVSLDFSKANILKLQSAEKSMNVYDENVSFYDCQNLKIIILPDTITSIGRYAFKGCSSLTSINIPKKIKTLSKGMFKDCTSLTSITIPNNVTRLEGGNVGSNGTESEGPFVGCTALTEISIPESVTNIGAGSFKNCTSLRTISIPNGIKWLEGEVFYGCESLVSITLPNSLTDIFQRAFYGCSSLKTITLLSVTNIYSWAFEKCSSLENIAIPNGIEIIQTKTFKDCIALKNCVIPNTVTKIEHNVFMGCSELESITIPSSVTDIRSNVFKDCKKLTNVYIHGTEKWKIMPDEIEITATDSHNNAILITGDYCNKTWLKQSN
ncbi:MAG: leucine-rich repeat protein, partial [Lachnospiraceae bacterium]|nr:leucine-rich repeat protein [Lachnospiraceae bacterium]